MPDENKSYAFITDTEGYIYCYDSENEEIIYYTSPSDGSYPIQAVNCWEKKAGILIYNQYTAFLIKEPMEY